MAVPTRDEAEAWASAEMEFASPALEEVMADLSTEEQLRLQKQCLQSPPRPMSGWSERVRDMFIVPQVLHALRYYNARHPGAEFEAVKPLMQCRVGFRGQSWFHLNFWARSRGTTSSNRKQLLKRFFAEVHYKPAPATARFVAAVAAATTSHRHHQAGTRNRKTPSPPALVLPESIYPTPIVEACTIIEEPLSQYRRSCAFCPGSFDILHPKGSRKFVCGNDKDRTEQRLVQCNAGIFFGMPFTGGTPPPRGGS